jgi:hypothetical protein
VANRAYTDAELDAAIVAISEPTRLRAAEELVGRAAPSLQRVLNEALEEGGWFGPAHEQVVREACLQDDAEARVRSVRTLIAEETRLGMLVGVAVGFELARELDETDKPGRVETDLSGADTSPPHNTQED